MKKIAVLLALISLPVLAADAPAAPSFLGSIVASAVPVLLTFALNPATWGVVAGIFYLLFIRGHAVQAKVDQAIRAAFYIVEDMKTQGKLPRYLDKPEVALQQLKNILDTQGIGWKDEFADLAKLAWSAMHGASNASATTQAITAVAAASAVPPKPAA